MKPDHHRFSSWTNTCQPHLPDGLIVLTMCGGSSIEFSTMRREKPPFSILFDPFPFLGWRFAVGGVVCYFGRLLLACPPFRLLTNLCCHGLGP